MVKEVDPGGSGSSESATSARKAHLPALSAFSATRGFAEQLLHVRDRPQVAELLGVDDRVDRLDLAVGDVEDMTPISLVRIDVLGAWLSVDLRLSELHPTNRLEAQPHPVAKHLRHALAAEDRLLDRRRDPAAVAVQRDVLGEQRLEPFEVTVLSGRDKARREPLALLGRGVEGAGGSSSPAGAPRRQLAAFCSLVPTIR